MCDVRYFKAARHNYIVAVTLKQYCASDEAMINDIAYNLQQCVEKTLKAFLECVGVTVPNTHSISKLINMSNNNGSSIVITDWIKNNSYVLESWESETRYNFDFFIEWEKLQEALEEIDKFLDINGLSDNLLPEVDKEIIRNCLPKDVQPDSNFEWNCYYNILTRKRKL